MSVCVCHFEAGRSRRGFVPVLCKILIISDFDQFGAGLGGAGRGGAGRRMDYINAYV